MANLSPQVLRELLTYNPDTGELFWKHRDTKWFPHGRFAKTWNTRFANNKAFTSVDSAGYFRGSVFGDPYLAHRVAWAVYYGAWPSKFIDHIDGNKINNRLDNLRDVTVSDNGKNTKKPHHNTSGCVGVYWHKYRKKWCAFIKVNGKQKHLGIFKDKNSAIAARKDAEVQYGFHANHGMR